MLWKGFHISDPWFTLFTTIFFLSLPKVIWRIKAVQADKKRNCKLTVNVYLDNRLSSSPEG